MRTHCPNGHPRVPVNRAINATSGTSFCRVCRDEREHRRHQQLREQNAARAAKNRVERAKAAASFTVAELAWAAGILEGEGTIRINKANARGLGSLHVSVVNTDYDVVGFFVERWPGSCHEVRRHVAGHRPAWRWNIAARVALAFLEAVQPYLMRRVVREKARLAIEYQKSKRQGPASRGASYRASDVRAYQEMLRLNARGAAPSAHKVLGLVNGPKSKEFSGKGQRDLFGGAK